MAVSEDDARNELEAEAPPLTPTTQHQSHAMFGKGGRRIAENGTMIISGEFVRLEDGSDRETDTTKDSSGQGAVPDFLTGKKLLFVMTGLTLVMFLAMIDTAIIATAIPQITSDFHRLEHVGWYIGVYQLASAALQPLSGKIFTYFNSKWSYLAFFFVFELGSVISGAASNSEMLIVGRTIAGLGYSGLTSGTLTIIACAIAPNKRPFHTSIAMGVSQIGIILGPILGGVFTEFASWRWCFYINLPLGAVTALCLLFTDLPDQISKEPMSLNLLHRLLPRFDLIGFALFAPAAVMALLALQFGSSRTYGWNSATVIGLFCGAAAVAGLFIVWEHRMGAEAMIPLSMVRKRVVWTGSLNFGFLMAVTIGASNFMPIYFQSVRGLSPAMSGLYMLVATGSQIIFIVVSGALMTKLGYIMPWGVLAGVFSAIATGLMSTWAPNTTLAQIFGYEIIYGARGVGLQVAIVAIQNSLPAAEVAIGSSLVVFFSNFITAVVVTVGNTIFQESLVAELAVHTPTIAPAAAIAAGGSAQAVRALVEVSGANLDGLLLVYTLSFNKVFYLLVACSLIVFLTAFGVGRIDLRPKKRNTEKV